MKLSLIGQVLGFNFPANSTHPYQLSSARTDTVSIPMVPSWRWRTSRGL